MPKRWVAGLGFFAVEGFTKCGSFFYDLLWGHIPKLLIMVRIEAIAGSAFLHILIASIVLSFWQRSKLLAFFLGLGLHVCHNGAVAIFAAGATQQSAHWVATAPVIYFIIYATCFSRYDTYGKQYRKSLIQNQPV